MMNEIKWYAIEEVDAPGCSKIIDADGYSVTGIISTNIAKKIVMMNNKEMIENNNLLFKKYYHSNNKNSSVFIDYQFNYLLASHHTLCR